MKRPHESNASSSSTTLNHLSASHPLDDTLDENDDESFHSNSSSLSQNISLSSNVISKTDNLDAYDLSSTKAVLMANLLSCDPEVLSEIHSGSNTIPYSQYLQESQDAVIQDTNPSVPNDLLVLSLVEQMTDHVAHLDKENQTNKMVNKSLTAKLKRYKERIAIFEQRLNVDLNKREKLIDSQMDDLIRDRNAKLAESKEKECKYIDKEIVLEKQNKELENIISLDYQNPFHLKKAQQIQPTLYDGSVIAKEHVVIYVLDDEETLILEEETLILEEESRSKMLDKQNDPISIEKKIKISPIDY
ncbi:hypothetical protein Tco_0409500 [Tanacetum coccineum]